jgi:hypothetical protein
MITAAEKRRLRRQGLYEERRVNGLCPVCGRERDVYDEAEFRYNIICSRCANNRKTTWTRHGKRYEANRG